MTPRDCNYDPMRLSPPRRSETRSRSGVAPRTAPHSACNTNKQSLLQGLCKTLWTLHGNLAYLLASRKVAPEVFHIAHPVQTVENTAFRFPLCCQLFEAAARKMLRLNETLINSVLAPKILET
jgi:hypothetical protein